MSLMYRPHHRRNNKCQYGGTMAHSSTACHFASANSDTGSHPSPDPERKENRDQCQLLRRAKGRELKRLENMVQSNWNTHRCRTGPAPPIPSRRCRRC